MHEAFDVGVMLKGLDGILEIIGGVLFAFVNPMLFGQAVAWLTAHELSEDPRDIFSHYLTRMAHDFSASSQAFGSLYLLSHGVIKIILVYSLLKRRLWAYPAAIVFFALFIAYQLYRYTYSHSIWMILLSILDLAVIGLTWWEYRHLKRDPF